MPPCVWMLRGRIRERQARTKTTRQQVSDTSGNGAHPWAPDTTLAEVVSFAVHRIELFLLLYAKAYRDKNDRHMIENIKLLRNVVSRLDQFRRMKVRQWAREQSQTQPEGESHK